MESSNSRVNKVIKNFVYGAGAQVLLTLFPFVNRTIFIYTLGVDYLGISGLFSSILSVLSMAELGIGNIVIYSLYKPVAEGNKERIRGLIGFYKKIYYIIAFVIMSVGLALVPFLSYLINLPEQMEHLVLYYILYLVNSSASYLCVFKISIIRADQKEYLVSVYTTVGTMLMYVVQMACLLFLKNYTMYLIIQIIFTFGTNYLLSAKAEKDYPYIRKCRDTIDLNEKKQIMTDTFAMMKYKVGGVLLNSTDNMFISKLIGTRTVGFYNNYLTLEKTLNQIINVIYNSVYTSVGNINAIEKEEKKKNTFDLLVYIFVWIATFATVGFISAVDDLVAVWIGSDYCLERAAVIALSINFYLPIVLYPVWMYRNTTGLFNETKNILLYASLLNVFFSYVFGRKWGLAGILIATSVSRCLTSFWYEPYVLYKKIFPNNTFSEYFIMIAKSVIIVFVSCAAIKMIVPGYLSPAKRLVFDVVCSLSIPNVLFVFANYNKNLKKLLQILMEKTMGRRRNRVN